MFGGAYTYFKNSSSLSAIDITSPKILTIDIEDVSSAFPLVKGGRGLEANLIDILKLLDQFTAKCTFFTVANVARKHPKIIRQIVREGHEIACHGLDHVKITSMSRHKFREDLKKAKNILEDLSGNQVQGYRAPCFSIGTKCQWALDDVAAQGFRYDSSLTDPLILESFDKPQADCFPRLGNGLLEVFPAHLLVFGKRWLLRSSLIGILPYRWMRAHLCADGRALYFHPYNLGNNLCLHDDHEYKLKEVSYMFFQNAMSNRFRRNLIHFLTGENWSSVRKVMDDHER